jgi:Spy/CpxP family protein refolding chaperone
MPSRIASCVLAMILTLAIFSSTSYAGPWGAGSCCPAASGSATAPSLSDEQQKQVTALNTEYAKKALGIRTEMEKKRIELLELSGQDNLDEQAVQKKREEVWALQDSMRTEMRAYHTKIRGLLTPEQRKQMGALDSGPGMGRGMGCGGGGCGAGACGGGRGMSRM